MENPAQENPSKPTEPPEQADAADNEPTLGDLLDSARRAHELVDALDLKKVSAHDQEEIQKLKAVSAAMEDLAQGKRVEHVDGVDDVVPALNEAQKRRSELLQILTQAGWSDNIGRILTNNEEGSTTRPMEIIPHQEGLPQFDVCLAPLHAKGLGNFAVCVSAAAVFATSLREPPEKHLWRTLSSGPYEGTDELLQLIDNFTSRVFE